MHVFHIDLTVKLPNKAMTEIANVTKGGRIINNVSRNGYNKKFSLSLSPHTLKHFSNHFHFHKNMNMCYQLDLSISHRLRPQIVDHKVGLVEPDTYTIEMQIETARIQ